MANEGPLQHWGWGISGFDARNSSVTGTTLSGPNGSAQFLAVKMSTVALTVSLTTGSGERMMGLLQNKPSTGIAADVGYQGFSKAVAGATITPGVELMVSSTAAGTLIPATTGLYAIGRSINGAAVGEVFDAYLFGNGGSSLNA